MNRHSRNASQSTSPVAWGMIGIALGALAMYVLDPAQGNSRRALARDKMHSAKVSTRKTFDSKSRDIANRAHGLRAEANRLIEKIRGMSKQRMSSDEHSG